MEGFEAWTVLGAMCGGEEEIPRGGRGGEEEEERGKLGGKMNAHALVPLSLLVRLNQQGGPRAVRMRVTLANKSLAIVGVASGVAVGVLERRHPADRVVRTDPVVIEGCAIAELVGVAWE